MELIVDRRFVLDPVGYCERPDLAGAGVDARGFEFDLAAAMPGYDGNARAALSACRRQ